VAFLARACFFFAVGGSDCVPNSWAGKVVRKTVGGRFYSPVAKAGKPNFAMYFVVLDALGPLRDKVWVNGRSRFGESMSLSPWLPPPALWMDMARKD